MSQADLGNIHMGWASRVLTVHLADWLDRLLNCRISDFSRWFDWAYSCDWVLFLLSVLLGLRQRIVDLVATNCLAEIVLHDKEGSELEIWRIFPHFISGSWILRSLSNPWWVYWRPFNAESTHLSLCCIKVTLVCCFQVSLRFDNACLSLIHRDHWVLLFHCELEVFLRTCCCSSCLGGKRCFYLSIRYHNLASVTSVRLLITDLPVDGVYRTTVCFRAARHSYYIIDVHIAISVYLLE